MNRALRITHFDKNKKAKSLELSFDYAEVNEKGYTQEGKLLIGIQSEDQKAYFQLSVSEASLLVQRLNVVLDMLASSFIETEREARERSKVDAGQFEEAEEE
ncbi:hypothetical protein [Metallosphaera sedula]|uniref:hypothetical protein n=1 Tax=Metallosphaera sedula TaxID=43687 RepID=UPI0020BFB1D5|nr:hypothetical protein [Metallosphaera sedula]BBL45991.1 hypothetical protein MJ1HA_0078 [Metallosphaera sedula]